MQPSLGIVIINWNSYKVTSQCLLSLRTCSYENYEIILVDNASQDGSAEQLKKEFPEITLLRNEKNIGFTGGNNTGIRYALELDKEFVMLLNNDTEITSNFAEILIQRFESDESLAAIQPKILYNQDRSIIWNAGSEFLNTFSLPRTIGYNRKDRGQYNKEKYIPWITGCCFLVRSCVVKEVGVLDDRFFMYYEDLDWSFRIKNKGYKLLYLPSSRIYHEVGKSQDNLDSFGEGHLSPFAHYVNVRNHLFIIRKHTSWFFLFSSCIYQIYKLAGYSTYFILKRRYRKLKATWKGVCHGISTSLDQTDR